MPQIAYRANLSASVFPMTLADAGRAVIMPGPDQNYDRRVDPTGEQKNAGIPQAIFLQDVMPTPDGYQSVGYKDVGAYPDSIPAGRTPLPYAYVKFYFSDIGLSKIIHCLLREGAAFYFDGISSFLNSDPVSWEPIVTFGLDIPDSASGIGISTAYVRGRNFLFDGITLYEVTNTGGAELTFVNVNASVTGGVTINSISSICSCANYLILLYEDGTILWSSTTDPLDFAASLVSGAGSIIPATLQGQVRFLVEAPNAFYIYTAAGVIYAQYTGNSRYPFKFTPIAEGGSYQTLSQVALNRASSAHFSIDNNNQIRRITPDGASIVAPEFTSFLERQRRYDMFDASTNAFSLASFSVLDGFPAKRAIYVIYDRYVVVPVGIYMYVYDTVLQRYGRLLQTGYVVQGGDPNAAGTGALETGFGDRVYFLEASTQQKISFDIYNTDYTFSGVLALGRFQFARSRKIKLEEIEFEGPPNASEGTVPETSCTVLPCQDGRNFDAPVIPYDVGIVGGLARYLCHCTAQNHTVLVKGAFSVNTLQLKFTPAGDR